MGSEFKYVILNTKNGKELLKIWDNGSIYCRGKKTGDPKKIGNCMKKWAREYRDRNKAGRGESQQEK